MAMGDPWIIGNVVFPWLGFGPAPAPALDPHAPYKPMPRACRGLENSEQARKLSTTDWARSLGLAALAEDLAALADGDFPCGWDERDAKV